MARQAVVPIVPILISGNDILKPRDKKFFLQPTVITIKILPPIFPDHPFHPVHEGDTVEEKEILDFFTRLFREEVKTFYGNHRPSDLLSSS